MEDLKYGKQLRRPTISQTTAKRIQHCTCTQKEWIDKNTFNKKLLVFRDRKTPSAEEKTPNSYEKSMHTQKRRRGKKNRLQHRIKLLFPRSKFTFRYNTIGFLYKRRKNVIKPTILSRSRLLACTNFVVSKKDEGGGQKMEISQLYRMFKRKLRRFRPSGRSEEIGNDLSMFTSTNLDNHWLKF